MLRPSNSRTKKELERVTAKFHAALPGSPGETYLESREIGRRTVGALRLGYVDPNDPEVGWEQVAGRLAIPYLNYNGDPVWVKFRDLTGTADNKYAQQAGGETRLYNLRALSVSGDTLVLCEGEFDTITMTALGIPAVGIPGANNWKAHHYRILQGYSRYVMFYDDDKPGRELVKTVRAKLPDVIPVAPPGGFHDVSEAYVAGKADDIRRLVKGDHDEDFDEPPY